MTYDQAVRWAVARANMETARNLDALGLLDGELGGNLRRITRPGDMAETGAPIPDKDPPGAMSLALEVISALSGRLVEQEKRIAKLEKGLAKKRERATK
jgi:hypothetical protein